MKFSLCCAKRDIIGSNDYPSKEDIATENIALKQGARTLALNKGIHDRMQQTVSFRCITINSTQAYTNEFHCPILLHHKRVNSKRLEDTSSLPLC